MKFITVTSLDIDELQAYVGLNELQLRNRLEPERGIFIAESQKVIERAIAANMMPLSLLVEETWIESMTPLFHEIESKFGNDIPVYVASPQQLHSLTGYRLHRGTIAAMRRPPLPSVDDVCRNAQRIAVLENIVDHTNVGAIVRSAAALDVDAILVTPSCADPLYRRSIRVSMGTIFQIPWTRIGGDDTSLWPQWGLEQLQQRGFTTAAMALDDNSISLQELSRRLKDPNHPSHIERLAMIFGTEGDGLTHNTIAHCDLTVKIPMSHGVDSLNVAAASAVTFYATQPE